MLDQQIFTLWMPFTAQEYEADPKLSDYWTACFAEFCSCKLALHQPTLQLEAFASDMDPVICLSIACMRGCAIAFEDWNVLGNG